MTPPDPGSIRLRALFDQEGTDKENTQNRMRFCFGKTGNTFVACSR